MLRSRAHVLGVRNMVVQEWFESSPRPSPAESLPQRLALRRADFYMKQTAHVMEGAKCDRLNRRIGIVVVILTTVVGTSVIVSLGESPQWWAKTIVGVLSVAAAIAAAWKENAQYARRTQTHEAAAASFEKLRYKVEELRDKSMLKLIECADLERELEKIEAEADDLTARAPPLPDKSIPRAVKFIVDLDEQRRNLVQASF